MPFTVRPYRRFTVRCPVSYHHTERILTISGTSIIIVSVRCVSAFENNCIFF